MATKESKLIVSLLDRLSAPARGVAASINRLTAASKANAARMDAMHGRMAAAGAVAYGLAKAVAAPVRSAMAWEDSMLGVAKQMDGARDASGNLSAAYYEMGRDIQKLGRVTPIANNELADMVTAGLRMGVAKDEVLGFVAETAKMSTAFEMPAGALADSMGKIAGLYKIPIPAIGQLGDSINYLDDNAISTGAGIIQYLQDVGGVAGSVKITGKDMAALGSTMLTLGENAGTAGTATNAIFSRFAAATKDTKKARAAYKAIGLSAKQVQAGMQTDAFGTLLNVLDAVNKMPEKDRLGILTEMVGREHSDTLAKLVTQTAELRRQRDLANSEAAKGSMSREYEARLKTFSAQAEIFSNRTSELKVAVGSALLPALNDMLGALGPLASRLAEWADAHPQLTRVIVGTTAGLVGLRVAALAAQFSMLWMKGGLIDAGIVGLRGLSGAASAASLALTPLGRAMGLVAPSARQVAVATAEQAAATLAQRQAAYQSALAMQQLAAKGQVVGVSMRQATAGVKEAGAAVVAAQAEMRAASAGLAATGASVGVVTRAFQALKIALISTGIGAAVVGIAAAGTWIWNNWSNLAAMFRGFGDAFLLAISPLRPVLDPVINGISSLFNWISNLLGPIEGAEQSFGAFGVAAGRAVGQAVMAVVELPGKILALAGDVLEAGKALGRALYDGVVELVSQLASYIKTTLSNAISSVAGAARNLASKLTFGLVGGSDSDAGVDGARAGGGPVRAGGSYLVGERGPEIFRPRQSGFIEPNAVFASARRSTQAAAPAAAATRNVEVNQQMTFYVTSQADPRAIAAEVAANVRTAVDSHYMDGL